jgi:hypothetical protein
MRFLLLLVLTTFFITGCVNIPKYVKEVEKKTEKGNIVRAKYNAETGDFIGYVGTLARKHNGVNQFNSPSNLTNMQDIYKKAKPVSEDFLKLDLCNNGEANEFLWSAKRIGSMYLKCSNNEPVVYWSKCTKSKIICSYETYTLNELLAIHTLKLEMKKNLYN